MRPDLKPCPFCGAPATLKNNKRLRYCEIACENPECDVRASLVTGSEASAVAAWNRRAAAPEPPVRREDA